MPFSVVVSTVFIKKTLELPRDLATSRRPFWMTSSGTIVWKSYRQSVKLGRIHKCPVNIVFTDGHYMMTSSNGNIFHVTGHLRGEFTGDCWIPPQRPVTPSSEIFFDLRMNKLLSKQWWCWWFETPLRPLWFHCNEQVHWWQSLSPLWKDSFICPWTKWPPFRRRHFQMHFREWKSLYFASKFLPRGPVNNKSELVEVRAWRRTGDTPLPQPMPTQLTYA